MFTDLTSYLCKPEYAMSDLIERASREAYGSDIKGNYCTENEVLH